MTTAYRALGEALEAEHGDCQSNTCIVCAALRSKLYLHAAHVFTSVIDNPESKVLPLFKALCPTLENDGKVLEESDRFVLIQAMRCPGCDEYIYLNRETFGNVQPKWCSSCGEHLESQEVEEPRLLEGADWDTLVTNAIVEDVINQHEKDKMR